MAVIMQMSIKQIHGTRKLLLGQSYIQNKIATSSILGKADGTPFTTAPISDTMGYTGMSFCGIDLVENGTLPQHTGSLSGPTQDVFNRISDTDRNTPPDNDYLTFESFTKAIAKRRESTSMSPFRKHVDHYKSLLDIDSKSSTYTEDNPDPGPNALQVLCHTFVATFRSG